MVTRLETLEKTVTREPHTQEPGASTSREARSDTLYPRGEPNPPSTDLISKDYAGLGGYHLIVPDVLPEAVLAKIEKDEFVDFADILYDTKKKFHIGAGDGDTPAITFEEKPRQSLSWLDWNTAFTRYAHAYTRVFPKADTDLRLYHIDIQRIANKGGMVWAKYDEKFRRERKALRLPWCIWRQDLINDLSRPPPSAETAKPQKFSKGGRAAHQKYQSGGYELKGRCLNFNKDRCQLKTCPYDHVCLDCSGNHPVLRCPRREATGGRKRQHKPVAQH